MRRVFLIVLVAGAVASSPVWAQSSSGQGQTQGRTQTQVQTQAQTQAQVETKAERMGTATYWGDTGLWFVPTAEVLRPKGWSLSAYRKP